MAVARLLLIAGLSLTLIWAIQAFTLSSEQLESIKEFHAKRAGDRSHWCCRTALTPHVVQTTRPEVHRYITHENYTYISGYEPCDGSNVNDTWSFCPVYKTNIVEKPAYRMVNVKLTHTEVPQCKEKDLICCKGYTLYMDNCYLPDKLETIKSLIDAGLIG